MIEKSEKKSKECGDNLELAILKNINNYKIRASCGY